MSFSLMQLFFWGNEIVLYERALKIAIFREIRQAIAWPTVTESSIWKLKAPGSMETYTVLLKIKLTVPRASRLDPR